MTGHSARAARHIDSNPAGALLLDLARERHPTIAWWWGRRTVDGETFVQCYVCDERICSWNGNMGTWVEAEPLIERHRESHLATVGAEITDNRET